MKIKHVKVSPSDLCNLSCQFCPRGHPEIYPNNNEHMSMDTFNQILHDVSAIKSHFYFEIVGNGEPTIGKHFKEMTLELHKAKEIYPNMTTRLVSNGARFDRYKKEIELYDEVILDVYTNDEAVFFNQVSAWRHLNILSINMVNQYGKLLLRYDGEELIEMNGAMLLNSRANSFEIPLLGPLNPPDHGFCEKPSQDITFNHKGEYILCHEDWHGKGLASVNDESIYDFYHFNERYVQYKNDLEKGIRRGVCEGCSHPGNNKFYEKRGGKDTHKPWLKSYSEEWEKNIAERFERQAALPDFPVDIES